MSSMNTRENATGDAMRANAATLYHPVRAYLDSLTWDKERRLDAWFTHHLGVEDTALHRAYSARFLISAAREFDSQGVKWTRSPC